MKFHFFFVFLFLLLLNDQGQIAPNQSAGSEHESLRSEKKKGDLSLFEILFFEEEVEDTKDKNRQAGFLLSFFVDKPDSDSKAFLVLLKANCTECGEKNIGEIPLYLWFRNLRV
jgi:hypothetical protein